VALFQMEDKHAAEDLLAERGLLSASEEVNEREINLMRLESVIEERLGKVSDLESSLAKREQDLLFQQDGLKRERSRLREIEAKASRMMEEAKGGAVSLQEKLEDREKSLSERERIVSEKENSVSRLQQSMWSRREAERMSSKKHDDSMDVRVVDVSLGESRGQQSDEDEDRKELGSFLGSGHGKRVVTSLEEEDVDSATGADVDDTRMDRDEESSGNGDEREDWPGTSSPNYGSYVERIDRHLYESISPIAHPELHGSEKKDRDFDGSGTKSSSKKAVS
jgi:hypothetical protein